MKINFKKISAITMSTLMVGMSAGFAAAANYPAPFVSGGVANVAVVYGTGAGVSALDQTQAISIQTDLASGVTTTGGTTTIEGESIEIRQASTVLNLGEGSSDVISTAITKNSPSGGFPTILKDLKYVDNDNDEFDYTQKITLSNISVTMFEDSDYKADEPTVGVRMASGNVLNYTLTFTDKPLWSDLTSTDLEIMGKKYFVLSYTNGTKLTLLDSATTTTLSEGETTTVGGHDVSINFIGSSSVKLEVDGVLTNTLSAGGTQKLSDGSYVGIKEINTQDYAGGIKTVEFSIGTGKLELTTNSLVALNDDSISGLTAILNTSGTSSGDKITGLTLQWDVDDELYATATGEEITMPGFESIKISFTGLDYPVEEKIQVKHGGTTYMQLADFPLKDATVTIPILYGDSINWTGVGKDSSSLLGTTFNATLRYDKDNFDYFVATYDNGKDCESYLMRATDITNKSNIAKATFEYKDDSSATGWSNVATDVVEGDTVTIGSVLLTVGNIQTASSADVINFTAGSNVNFHTLCSKEGMKVYLPSNTTEANGGSICNDGAANFAGCLNYTSASGNATFNLIFSEEDKDGNKYGGNNITVQLGWNTATTKQGQVSAITLTPAAGTEAGGSASKEIRSTDVYRQFVYSELATELLWDKSGDQDFLDIIYHGEEVTAGLYVSEGKATSSSTTTQTGVMVVMDSEISSVASKNLIIVGGSCINSAAATVLGGAYCGPSFTQSTGVGSGQFLIKGYADKFTSGKLALLVAGYEVDDTVNAAKYLMNKEVDTSKAYVGTSATEATLSVA